VSLAPLFDAPYGPDPTVLVAVPACLLLALLAECWAIVGNASARRREYARETTVPHITESMDIMHLTPDAVQSEVEKDDIPQRRIPSAKRSWRASWRDTFGTDVGMAV
jgi:hypothetical protein